MKFLTSDGLNENLHELFEKIVKPYIVKEKRELPWRNKKVVYTKPSNYDFQSSYIFKGEDYNSGIVSDTYKEAILNFTNSSDNSKVFLKSDDGKNWEEVVSNHTFTNLVTALKTENGTYYLNTGITGNSCYSTDGLKTVSQIPTSVLPANSLALLLTSPYTFIRLKNNKVLAYSSKNGIYKQNTDGTFTSVFKLTDTALAVGFVAPTDNYVFVFVMPNDVKTTTPISIYKASIDDLNFTLVAQVPRAAEKRLIRFADVTDTKAIIGFGTSVYGQVSDGIGGTITTVVDYNNYYYVEVSFETGAVTNLSYDNADYLVKFKKLKSGRIFTSPYGKDFISYTDDGHTWTHIRNPNYVYTKMIQIDNGIILTITAQGIMISYDNGEHFELKSEGSYKDIIAFGNTVSLLTAEGVIEAIEF